MISGHARRRKNGKHAIRRPKRCLLFAGVMALLVAMCMLNFFVIMGKTKTDDTERIRDDHILLSEYRNLPEALHPISFQACCEEQHWTSTCFTEKACNSSVYPFATREEADFFRKWKLQKSDLSSLKKQCKEANDRLEPPMKWCQSMMGNTNSTPPAMEELFPFGCSRFSMEGGSGPYDRMIVFPQGKLAFCGIPKVGITQWIQFLRFTIGAKDYQSLPWVKKDKDLFHLDIMRPSVQRQVFFDPSWTKAVFIRHPAERLLSAYLDKVKNEEHFFGRKNVTFEEFVNLVTSPNITEVPNRETHVKTGVSWYSDVHWRPQAWSCGLSEFMPNFNYVATMDRADYHTKKLLEQVGLWKSFGKHYREERKKPSNESIYAMRPPSLHKDKGTIVGFQQHKGVVGVHHRQTARKLDQYYTDELMAIVKKAYWMDFKLWDALKQADQEGLVRGKDIVHKLNAKCQT